MDSTLDPDAALLLSHSPVSLWRRYTSQGEPALLRYAQAVSPAYPPNAPLGQCTLHPELPAEKRLVYHWQALVSPKLKVGLLDILLLLLRHFHLAVQHKAITFRTVHGFSKLGARQAKRRRFWATALYALSFFVFLVTLLGVIAGIPMYWLATKDPAFTADDMRIGGLILAGIIATFLASIYGMVIRKKIEIPPALRFIPRYPFALAKISEL